MNLSFLFLIGCDDNFNPNGEYKEIYALTGILKGDESSQTVTLSHVYRIDGFDPYSNTIDPAIVGADMRIWIGDSVYVFHDSSIVRTDTTRYSTPFYYYYNNQFTIPVNKTIQVEVLLQNGKRLKAETKSPNEVRFDKASNTILPPDSNGLISFIWNEQTEPLFYAPQLTIRYLQNVNGATLEKIKVVPIKYVSQNNEQVPVYPKASNKVSVLYQTDALNKAMREISEGDSNKANFSLFQKQVFSVIAFDLNLTRYLSATDQSFDDLTVTVNESDYTNVDGGLGIFGCYTIKDFGKVELSKDYVESFGYNYRVGE